MPLLRAHAPLVFLSLLALWLWWPALGAVPVEGFDAMVASIARGWQAGTLDRVDAAYPFDTEFYLLTRFGMSGLIALFPFPWLDANLIFSIITALSFVAAGVSSGLFARQWTTASPTSILFALIILPGFAESAFFLHENLVALACFAFAMVLIGARQDIWAAALSGLLLGVALLTRSDFILLTPALPLILWARGGPLKGLTLRLAVGVAATLLAFSTPLMALGLTPIDVVNVARHSVDLWARESLLEIPLREGFVFFGAAALLLLPIGMISTARHASWPVRLLLIGVPLLFIAMYGSKLWQARQFLPILPFALALVAVGASTLWRYMPSVVGRAAACLLLAFFWLWPGPIVLSDGPRLLTGQFWSPLVWHDWQNQVRDQLAGIDGQINQLADGGIIITDEWTMDRYVHLAFRENGWTPAFPTLCKFYVEVWEKPDRTAYHARISVPFVVGPENAMPALLDDFINQCLPTIEAPSTHHLAVDWSAPSGTSLPSWLKTPPYWTVAPAVLDSDGLASLQRAYRDDAVPVALSMEEVSAQAANLQGTTGLLR